MLNGINVTSSDCGKVKHNVQSTPAQIIYPTLSIGSIGGAVELLQTKLNEHGYNLNINGNFDTLTEKAVLTYQENNGLEADGIASPLTWKKLDEPENLVHKTNYMLAKEVIAGKWGNNEEHKKNLENTGYNYEAVQREINKIFESR